MKMILALTVDHGLGKDNDLLVKDAKDMKYFKEYTMGHSVVMGRKTWESLNTKPLKGRKNYVITSQPYCSEHSNVHFIKDLSEAPDDAIVIGGRSVYLAALEDKRLEEISLTKFNYKLAADVYLREVYDFLLDTREFKQTDYINRGFDQRVFVFNRIKNEKDDEAT